MGGGGSLAQNLGAPALPSVLWAVSGCRAEPLLSHTRSPHPFFQTPCSGSGAPVIEPEAPSVLTNWPCSTTQVITMEQAECSLSPFIKARHAASLGDVQGKVHGAPLRRQKLTALGLWK